ncbi:hypothetical protein HYG86_12745 [Alkalicella caledoniensis]|uniref:Uncharacterized protein n=1 Tax=Alkalicella caledoniensis TaxID=2731377 RepID=A0A7G9WA64_ALKCA|nr:hypothetical protein [Alkalicella caledoniensis]QNO15576.1 hypothetical protein HYG86_12745 [Alkalicella caledoniensis]
MFKKKKFIIILFAAVFILIFLVNFLYTRQGTLGEFLENEDVEVNSIFMLDLTPEERDRTSDFEYKEENRKILQEIFESNLDMVINKTIFYYFYPKDKGSEVYILNLTGNERIFIYEDMISIHVYGKFFERIYLTDDNTLYKAIKESDIQWR